METWNLNSSDLASFYYYYSFLCTFFSLLILNSFSTHYCSKPNPVYFYTSSVGAINISAVSQGKPAIIGSPVASQKEKKKLKKEGKAHSRWRKLCVCVRVFVSLPPLSNTLSFCSTPGWVLRVEPGCLRDGWLHGGHAGHEERHQGGQVRSTTWSWKLGRLNQIWGRQVGLRGWQVFESGQHNPVGFKDSWKWWKDWPDSVGFVSGLRCTWRHAVIVSSLDPSCNSKCLLLRFFSASRLPIKGTTDHLLPWFFLLLCQLTLFLNSGSNSLTYLT